MKKPHLSIIIPVLNLWEMTAECLKSIKTHTPGSFYEVIVVDNGSADETSAECPLLAEALFEDRYQYIRLPENINFGPACNRGAQAAEGALLFFLNNDTLLTKNWFKYLLEAFRHNPRVMGCSPLCLFPENDRIQHLGIAFDGGLNVRHPYFLFPGDHPVTHRKRTFQALSAAAFMTPANVFNELGEFFPEYINGFEDMDLCCRIRKKRGILVQENRSVIYHWASKTPGRNKFDAHNSRLINKRCPGLFTPDLHKIILEDGFRCELTPWLEMILRDPDEIRMAELDLLSGEEELAEALHKYPLWENGYDRLAALYEQDGRISKAADILFYGTSMFPAADRLARLADLAEKSGADNISRQSRAKITSIKNTLAAPEGILRQAQDLMGWALENKDRELAAIYKKWIQEYNKN
ncbi:glycosyltransferase family 2 protein [Maridesulfovibrio sp.]|uniref:glycosyltransferase family 2 protein n=1 Tax=Maridesulfovibrio sp. TaxID=2795000 RepID=UPI0039F01559